MVWFKVTIPRTEEDQNKHRHATRYSGQDSNQAPYECETPYSLTRIAQCSVITNLVKLKKSKAIPVTGRGGL
jgi:hypothetical protein